MVHFDILLENLRNGMPLTKACVDAGLTTSSVLNRAQSDDLFAQALTEARQYAIDNVEYELHKKALDGELGAIKTILPAYRQHYNNDKAVPTAPLPLTSGLPSENASLTVAQQAKQIVENVSKPTKEPS